MMVKKNFKVACFLMLILCLMGCAKETADDNSSGAETTTADKGESVRASMVGHAERYMGISLSEAGIVYDYYDDNSSGLVRLVTIGEGKDMVLCYNPNCKHKGEECMGYRGVGARTMYYNGAVYYFSSINIFDHKITKQDTNGAGREFLVELPFGYNISYFCICHNDKMYYDAEITYKDEVTKELTSVFRVVEVDLLDGSYRFLTEESEDIVSIASLKGDTMYMRMYDGVDGRLNMVAMDINTLEKKTIISKETWKDEYVFVNGYDEDSYFYADRPNREVGIRNVDGTVERVLFRGAANERYSNLDAYSTGVFYSRMYDYEDEPAGDYFMDLITGEVVNITDEAEKYGINGYDGNYDAFIKRGTKNDHGMWSREKIISEAKAGQ